MSFYQTKAWYTVRRYALERDRYRCVVCNASVGGSGEARVDHIKKRDAHPELELELSNLRTLCASCDNQSHREKGQAPGSPRNERFRIRGFDRNGEPLDPEHHWRR